jgi:hypothetical protein
MNEVRNLVEAAVEAAKKHGVVAVLIGGGDGAPPMAPSAAASDDVIARYNAASARVQALEVEVAKRDEWLKTTTTERDSFGTRIREAEATISSLRAGAGAATPGGTTAPAGGTLDDQSIDILGIEGEDVVKKLKGKGWDTIGKLRAAHLAGKLASEAKLSKDVIISVAWAILGKVPPAALPTGAPAVVVSSATPTGGATDVPAGITDRAWKERLNAARKKEREKKTVEARVAQATAHLATITDPAARAPIVMQIASDTGTLDVLGGQMFCLLWAIGLCAPGVFKSVKDVSVDVALQTAGLLQLVETPPTPVATA